MTRLQMDELENLVLQTFALFRVTGGNLRFPYQRSAYRFLSSRETKAPLVRGFLPQLYYCMFAIYKILSLNKIPKKHYPCQLEASNNLQDLLQQCDLELG